MQWIPLGTNGFYPSHDRQTMSFLLLERDGTLLLDAGTGVARLGEASIAEHLVLRDHLDVILTHYHLDHVVGLAALPAVWGGSVTIWGPGEPLVDAPGPEALERLLAPPLFPKRLSDFDPPFELRRYDGSALEIGPFSLRMRRQRHPGGSVGIRVNDRFAYITDTEADDATETFVAGVDSLLHEVWYSEREARGPDFSPAGHSSTAEVAEIADRAGVDRLLPIHHHPKRDDEELGRILRELEESARCEVVLPQEGTLFST